MPNIETRYTLARYTPQAAVSIATRAKEPAAPKVITGYGAVFYNAADPGTEYTMWSDFVERVMPGCFDRSIREDDVRSFFNHDENQILGRNQAGTLALSIDPTGLRYDVEPPDTELGRSVFEAVRRRDVSGSSFMFAEGDVVWRQIGDLVIRELNEVQLWEVGPVVFPAYPSSTSEVRSAMVAEAKRHGIHLDRPQNTVGVRRRLLELRARQAGL